jgi:uncharacterized protein (DUF1697 family)
MDRLRADFRSFGLRDARTVLASGNVIFDAGGENAHTLEERIEAGLQERLGYRVDTFIRSAEEVVTIARSSPFPEARQESDDRIHVIFLKDPPPHDLQLRLGEMVPSGDRFFVRDRDVFWLRRGTLSELGLRASDPVQAAGSARSTMRGMNTLKRLASTLDSTPA